METQDRIIQLLAMGGILQKKEGIQAGDTGRGYRQGIQTGDTDRGYRQGLQAEDTGRGYQILGLLMSFCGYSLCNTCCLHFVKVQVEEIERKRKQE